jgi:hypothetical protein
MSMSDSGTVPLVSLSIDGKPYTAKMVAIHYDEKKEPRVVIDGLKPVRKTKRDKP